MEQLRLVTSVESFDHMVERHTGIKDYLTALGFD